MLPCAYLTNRGMCMGRSIDYRRRMRDLREDADKSQTQIAEILGTSQTMYSRYECGTIYLPLRHFITLCQYYRVSADYLLGFSDKK